MGQDETGTLARFRTHRRELIDPKIVEHRGRLVKTTGDGLLAEFASLSERSPALSRSNSVCENEMRRYQRGRGSSFE